MAQGRAEQLNQEWVAFTNNLWKLQLLQNRDVLLTENIRAVWYDLSQGVMDIVVKLFVLAQLRALQLAKNASRRDCCVRYMKMSSYRYTLCLRRFVQAYRRKSHNTQI